MPLTSINKIDFKSLEKEELPDDIVVDYENNKRK